MESTDAYSKDFGKSMRFVVEGRNFYVKEGFIETFSSVLSTTSSRNLKDKKAEEFCWMLHYLHHEPSFKLTDANAAKLLPLAHEYKIGSLKEECLTILMKLENPRLEIVTVAQRCECSDLLAKAMGKCVEKLHLTASDPESIAFQMKLPENADLTAQNLNELYVGKISLLQEASNKAKKSLTSFPGHLLQ